MQRVATIRVLVDQHAEDAAFLFHRRSVAVDGSLFGATDIGRIDQRLDANLDGLFAAGEAGWNAAMARLADYQEPGEVFVAGAVALHWGERELLDRVLAAATEAGESGREGISGAIARTPPDRLKPSVADWLRSSDPNLRYFGLCALSHHRVDPRADLQRLSEDIDPAARLRALRLAGELGRRDLLPVLMASTGDAPPDVRMVAATAAVLLGGGEAAHEALDRLVATTEPAAPAIELRLLATPQRAAKPWLKVAMDQFALRPAAVAASGLLGDRTVLPWLVDCMRDPALAPAAGGAMRDLFEIDFNDTDLFTADIAALGERFVDVDDELLPLPVADRVERWWDGGRGGRDHDVFRSMRHERIGAIRGAIANPGMVLANWRRTRAFPAWS